MWRRLSTLTCFKLSAARRLKACFVSSTEFFEKRASRTCVLCSPEYNYWQSSLRQHSSEGQCALGSCLLFYFACALGLQLMAWKSCRLCAANRFFPAGDGVKSWFLPRTRLRFSSNRGLLRTGAGCLRERLRVEGSSVVAVSAFSALTEKTNADFPWAPPLCVREEILVRVASLRCRNEPRARLRPKTDEGACTA